MFKLSKLAAPSRMIDPSPTVTIKSSSSVASAYVPVPSPIFSVAFALKPVIVSFPSPAV